MPIREERASTMNRKLEARIALVVLLVSCPTVTAGAQYVGANGDLRTVTTEVTNAPAAGGLGTGQCSDLVEAHQLREEGRLDEAAAVLDSVLSCFAGLMTDTSATYVCVRERADLLSLRRELRTQAQPGRRGPIIRVNYALAEALQLKAFIASSRREWSRALAILETLARFAPYGPEAHCESGYILVSQGKPAQSLAAYRRAVALSDEHGTSPAVRAVALRGVGMALTELGRLDEARKAYVESLTIEPGSSGSPP